MDLLDEKRTIEDVRPFDGFTVKQANKKNAVFDRRLISVD